MMDVKVDLARRSARSAQLSSHTPLPPIGSKVRSQSVSTSDTLDTDRSMKSKHDDESSSGSSVAFDRPGEGCARPRITRAFHPETMFDEERKLRSISFTRNKPILSKHVTFDGREITLVTLDTQTDWDWLQKTELEGPSQTETSVEEITDKEETPKSGSKTDQQEEKAITETPWLQDPYNDEFGIPMLQLSSDTEDSSDDEVSHKKIKDDRSFLPSVGPPNILQYQRESEKHDIPVDEPEEREHVPDVTAYASGIFAGLCEFCNQPIKHFPSLEDQMMLPPESLYCCQEYHNFLQSAINTAMVLEEEHSKKDPMINVKPHEHVGTKQERKAAREKAAQRMREREMQRRQQEASGMQQHFMAFMEGGASKTKSGKGHPILGNVNIKDLFVARQMKTINYQLSSQRCLEEGWTLRAPSPMLDDGNDRVFIPEPLNPALIADGKFLNRPLIEKFYEDGQKFLTMFPDGTGNVFYPSGSLAILISSVKLGQYHYTINLDNNMGLAAAFEPNGYGYCYFPNGDIRLYIDQYGGMELDEEGGKRRKWSWKDQVTHVHAPPFQPICIGVNRNIGIRLMSQDNIAITFSAKQRSCRFNMGSRLKLVAPENIPQKEIGVEHVYLEDKKNQVEALLDKVGNLLKFPNNPKLDKMLPPLHVMSTRVKMEKLKQSQQVSLGQQSARNKKIILVN